MSAPREYTVQTHYSSAKKLAVIILSSDKSVGKIHRICLSVDASVGAVSGPEHYWGFCSSFTVQESQNIKGTTLLYKIPSYASSP